MPTIVFLALVSAFTFLGLARMAVITPRVPFLRVTRAMAVISFAIALIDPASGVALLPPVLLSRRLAAMPTPDTVEDLLARTTRTLP